MNKRKLPLEKPWPSLQLKKYLLFSFIFLANQWQMPSTTGNERSKFNFVSSALFDVWYLENSRQTLRVNFIINWVLAMVIKMWLLSSLLAFRSNQKLEELLFQNWGKNNPETIQRKEPNVNAKYVSKDKTSLQRSTGSWWRNIPYTVWSALLFLKNKLYLCMMQCLGKQPRGQHWREVSPPTMTHHYCLQFHD